MSYAIEYWSECSNEWRRSKDLGLAYGSLTEAQTALKTFLDGANTKLVYHVKDLCTAEPAALSPNYYASLKPEPIDVIAAWGLGFNLGCAVKYIARAGKKDPTKHAEDLRKAIKYLEHEIGCVEKAAV